MSDAARFRRHFRRVQTLLDEIDRLAALPDEELAARAPAVSGWSVAQQLQHIARANGSVAAGLLGLLEDSERGGPVRANLLGRILLLVGRIPRGRATAPRTTRAEDEPSAEAIRGETAEAREALLRCRDRAEDLTALDRTIAHPYFGHLSMPQWARFVGVHTAHHLRIVAEIRRAAGH